MPTIRNVGWKYYIAKTSDSTFAIVSRNQAAVVPAGKKLDVPEVVNTVPSDGVCITSPDGTMYRIKVSNLGILSTEVCT